MTFLITGATGLLGNNVVRKLLEQGEAVRVLCRQSSDMRSLEGLDVEVVRGDIVEPEAVRSACREVEHVVHSAAEVRIGRSGIEHQRRMCYQTNLSIPSFPGVEAPAVNRRF